MGNTLTRENVEEAFQSILAEYGEDHLYESYKSEYGTSGCFYAVPNVLGEDGKAVPSCIVGQIVQRINPEAFEEVADAERLAGTSTSARALLLGTWVGLPGDFGALTEDMPLMRALWDAQREQDNGKTWGHAYKTYRSTLAYWDSLD